MAIKHHSLSVLVVDAELQKWLQWRRRRRSIIIVVVDIIIITVTIIIVLLLSLFTPASSCDDTWRRVWANESSSISGVLCASRSGRHRHMLGRVQQVPSSQQWKVPWRQKQVRLHVYTPRESLAKLNTVHNILATKWNEIIAGNFAKYFSQTYTPNSAERASSLYNEFSQAKENYFGSPLTDDWLFNTELVSKIIARNKAWYRWTHSRAFNPCSPCSSVVLSKLFRIIQLCKCNCGVWLQLGLHRKYS